MSGTTMRCRSGSAAASSSAPQPLASKTTMEYAQAGTVSAAASSSSQVVPRSNTLVENASAASGSAAASSAQPVARQRAAKRAAPAVAWEPVPIAEVSDDAPLSALVRPVPKKRGRR